MASNSIVSAHTGGMAFSTSINGHAVDIDLTKEHGGDDSAPGPKILMLVSLAGCTGVDVVSILDKMKISFSDFTIKVDAELTDEHPRIYKDVLITYSIKVDEDGRGNVEKAIKLSQEKYCGVSEMFRAFATLDSKIVYLD
jgi:putative redox protein